MGTSDVGDDSTREKGVIALLEAHFLDRPSDAVGFVERLCEFMIGGAVPRIELSHQHDPDALVIGVVQSAASSSVCSTVWSGLDGSQTVLRMVAPRLAVLCNQFKPKSVSLYGGRGDFRLLGREWRAELSNRPGRVWVRLELIPESGS